MNFFRAGLIFSASTASKLIAGLAIVKIIAITLGADGLGRLGQFMSLISMVTILAGGGIASGVIKYVAEFKDDPEHLNGYLGAASFVSIAASLSLGAALALFANPISLALFKTADFAFVVQILALAQALIALSNLLTGLVNGYQRVHVFALVNVCAVTVGVVGAAFACYHYGMAGAMCGLIWIAICPVLFLAPWYMFGLRFDWGRLAPHWNRQKVVQFLRFSLMMLVSVLTMQMAQIVVRTIIEANSSWTQVGYWQAVSKISDAYLQFITVVLANYFLPRLSELKDRPALKREVLQAYRYAMPVLLMMGAGVYLCRDWIIQLVFSRDFLPMKEYFTFQLLGDCFKVAAYIGGYVAVAKAKTAVYVGAELVQSTMLVGFCALFVSRFGAVGATYAYCANYVVYFLMVMIALRSYFNKPDPSQ